MRTQRTMRDTLAEATNIYADRHPEGSGLSCRNPLVSSKRRSLGGVGPRPRSSRSSSSWALARSSRTNAPPQLHYEGT